MVQDTGTQTISPNISYIKDAWRVAIDVGRVCLNVAENPEAWDEVLSQ